MKILGIDPGYAIVGFGVIESQNGRYRPLDYGAITTPAKAEFADRLEIIYDRLSELLTLHMPEAISLEQLFYVSNAKTVIGVAEARGVILLACKKHRVPVFEYTPLQVKQAVTGYGKAEKAQVQEMTRKLLCLKSVPKPDDTADALAMAICHGQAAGSAFRRRLLEGAKH
ncbi:MAG: crossover junction endodeoxyribonuclease RuvC [Oscillospiraceae bacterium]|jgi:crossover junction endodeoxyribonuclease RuvC|nr:crossover junction endodeoxyribonuclease RuvC [Oscillospiraceae bacterium]